MSPPEQPDAAPIEASGPRAPGRRTPGTRAPRTPGTRAPRAPRAPGPRGPGPRPGTPGGAGPVVLAIAGAAFVLGIVAATETLGALIVPSIRAGFRVWGPITTLVAAACLAVAGLPTALALETLLRRRRAASPGLALGAYLLAGVGWAALGWWLWRLRFVPDLDLGAFAPEIALALAGSVLLWAGATIARRHAALVVCFAAAALIGALAATLLLVA